MNQSADQIQQRILSATRGGMQFLTDETVAAPIKHADGIVDLKWLLVTLLSGDFVISPRPTAIQPETPSDPDLK